MKNILILGGDGFCGWPTALHLSARGHRVTIADNLSRRAIDEELGAASLTPIAPITERLAAWEAIGGAPILFANIDAARDYHGLRDLLADLRPDTIIQLAGQRASPYSMKNAARKSLHDRQQHQRHPQPARRHHRNCARRPCRASRNDGCLRE